MNTYQERTMWLVETDSNVRQVSAIVGDADGKVINYYDTDGLPYQVEDTEQIFPSEEQAREAVADRIRFLEEKSAEVRRYVGLLFHIDPTLLPSAKDVYLQQPSDNYLDTLRNQRSMLKQINDLLRNYIRCGTLCVGARSIPKEQVAQVLWHDKCVELRLVGQQCNDAGVYTTTEAEYELIVTVFGYNYSNKNL